MSDYVLTQKAENINSTHEICYKVNYAAIVVCAPLSRSRMQHKPFRRSKAMNPSARCVFLRADLQGRSARKTAA